MQIKEKMGISFSIYNNILFVLYIKLDTCCIFAFPCIPCLNQQHILCEWQKATKKRRDK